MNYPNLYIEFFSKSHQEELLLIGAESLRARQLPARQRHQRLWLRRMRGGVIAFGLRRRSRRQRLARRHYAADWRAEIHAIITRDDGPTP